MNQDDRLVELLLRWEDATARGEPPAPEELCRDCPGLLPEFRRVLGRVGAADALLQGVGRAPDPDDLAARVAAGRYRPLGFHAAGGLGVVYTAEDGETGRTVALKLPQDWVGADDGARRRFLLEAEVTAKLEHPGVVPVYGVGRDDRGRPYYAMRFVRGATLGDALERFHAAPAGDPDEPGRAVEFRRLLRALVTVCETVAYAHDRGVMHRDIKPANVLLGPYGETLLVDWGLARRVGAADPDATRDQSELLAAGGPGPSLAGVAVGTPAYMSPEQARGEWDRVGPQADVFSLGATLYEILTGRAPYGSPGALEKARAGRFEAPRRLRRGVPRPLEAVCLKATALRPEDRYAGAKELAADVERWLADEPVSAWREPLSIRARRWVKRHRTLLTSAVATLAVATVILAATGYLLGRKNRELTAANGRLDTANAQLRDTLGERDEANAGLRAALGEVRSSLYFRYISLADQEWWNGRVAESELVLDDCPPEHRRWEWYHLKRRCRAPLLVRELPLGGVSQVAFLPDGRRIAAAGYNGNASVWEVDTGERVGHVPGGLLRFPLLSEDGSRVAFVTDPLLDRLNLIPKKSPLPAPIGRCKVEVYDLPAGRLVRTFEESSFFPLAFVLSPDGRRLAVTPLTGLGNSAVSIREVDTGREVLSIETPLPLRAVSRDGKRVAHAGVADGQVRVSVRDAGSGWEVAAYVDRTQDAPQGQIPVALSPDGSRLAYSPNAETITLRNLAAGGAAFDLRGHAGPVRALAFSADGRTLASAGDDRTVRLWDVHSGRERYAMRGHDAPVSALAFSPDGTRLVSGGGVAKVWDATTGSEARTLSVPGASPSAAAFAPTAGTFATLDSDDRIRVRDGATGRAVNAIDCKSPLGLTDPFPAAGHLACTPDGRLLAAFRDESIRIYEGSRLIRSLPGHPRGPARKTLGNWDFLRPVGTTALTLSPDGMWLVSAGGADGAVKLWDIRSGENAPPKNFPKAGEIVSALAFSPDGGRVAAASGNKITLSDAATGRVLHTLQSPTGGSVWHVAFSPDGRRLAGIWRSITPGRGRVTVWNSADGKEVFALPRVNGEPRIATFSPDGTRLFTAVGTTIQVWDAATGREVLTLRGHHYPVIGLGFTAPGRLVSVGQHIGRLPDSRETETKMWEAIPAPVGP